jgi:hypothetical protein
MGKREVYRRRAPLAECYNGLDYTRPQRAEPCPCTHYDYRQDASVLRIRIRKGYLPLPVPNPTVPLSKEYRQVSSDSVKGAKVFFIDPQI